MVFFLITNTDWREVPRVRHQIATLLLSSGESVFFLERKKSLLNSMGHGISVSPVTFSLPLRLHPKLRLPFFVGLLSFLDSFRVFLSFKRLLPRGCTEQVVFINFCQEIFHLQLFVPGAKHILFIHDHFPLQVNNRLIRRILEIQFLSSVRAYASDPILVSSKAIKARVLELSPYSKVHVFYPWRFDSFEPNVQFNIPRLASGAGILLYWGVKNNFLDLEFLREIEASLLVKSQLSFYIDQVWLVGPWANNKFKEEYENSGLSESFFVKDMPASSFNDIPLSRVRAGIIPYKLEGFEHHLSTVEMSNKTFSFLACGIPLIVRGMPNFIDKPFFYKVTDLASLLDALRSMADTGRLNCLDEINIFLSQNSGKTRYRQLMSLCS